MTAFLRLARRDDIIVPVKLVPASWRNPAWGPRAPRGDDEVLLAILDDLAPDTGVLVWGESLAAEVASMVGGKRLGDQGFRLIASNDGDILSDMDPGISAVAMDVQVLAAQVVAAVEARILRPGDPPATNLVPPTRLVVRQSTGGIPDPLLARALAMLRSQFDVDVGVRQVASRLGVHPRRIERAFIRHLGRTPQEVRLEAKASLAKSLIEAGASPSEAARACGYSRASGLLRLLNRRK
jgi:AraC-like DNA-binding protein